MNFMNKFKQAQPQMFNPLQEQQGAIASALPAIGQQSTGGMLGSNFAPTVSAMPPGTVPFNPLSTTTQQNIVGNNPMPASAGQGLGVVKPQGMVGQGVMKPTVQDEAFLKAQAQALNTQLSPSVPNMSALSPEASTAITSAIKGYAKPAKMQKKLARKGYM